MPRNKRKQRGRFWLSQHGTSPYWQITWYDRRRRQTRRISTSEADLGRAEVTLAEHIIKTERPRDANPNEVLLTVPLMDYLEKHATNLPSAQQAFIAGQHLVDFFGESLVSEITPDRQEDYVDARRGTGVADGTIGRELSVLRAALNRAHRRGEMMAVPFIMGLPSGEPRERWLSQDEVTELFNSIDLDHLRLFTLVALNTLARPDAVLDLTMFQIDFDDRLITLDPPGRKQTKKYRPVVPITNTLLPWLRACEGGHLVSFKGRPIKSVKRAFRRAREKAGLGADVTPYTLRHTMATELRRRGVPPWEVSGMLGHKSSGYSTTERYAKYAPDYLSHATRAIDAYFDELTQRNNTALRVTLV